MKTFTVSADAWRVLRFEEVGWISITVEANSDVEAAAKFRSLVENGGDVDLWANYKLDDGRFDEVIDSDIDLDRIGVRIKPETAAEPRASEQEVSGDGAAGVAEAVRS